MKDEDGPWADDIVSRAYTNRLRASLSVPVPGGSAALVNYGYDAIKRLKTVAAPAGTHTYTYHAGLNGITSPAALIQKLSLPNSGYITNTFDGMGRLLSTWLSGLNYHGYTYNQASQRTRLDRNDGIYVAYGYDGAGQLISARGVDEKASVTNRLQERFGYTYDAAGNLNYRTNNALVQSFTVTALNQLSNATRSGTLTVAGITTATATNVVVEGLSAQLYTDYTFARTNLSLVDGTNTFTADAYDNLGRTAFDTVNVRQP